MVGAQKAIKMASSLSPCKKWYSETIIMDNTTRSIMQFMTPILSIKSLIILTIILHLNIRKYNKQITEGLSFY